MIIRIMKPIRQCLLSIFGPQIEVLSSIDVSFLIVFQNKRCLCFQSLFRMCTDQRIQVSITYLEHHTTVRNKCLLLESTKLGIMVSTSIPLEISLSIPVSPLIVKLVFLLLLSDHQVGVIPPCVISSVLHRTSLAVSHLAVRSRVTIQNSVIAGSVTPGDCADIIDPSSANIRFSPMARPTVSLNSRTNIPRGRVGIVFPTFSQRNGMPNRPWTGINSYPCRK